MVYVTAFWKDSPRKMNFFKKLWIYVQYVGSDFSQAENPHFSIWNLHHFSLDIPEFSLPFRYAQILRLPETVNSLYPDIFLVSRIGINKRNLF